jgi:endonuclease/exonuclease/phosphatase (EEP) superfamily protein YafD
LGQRLRVLSSNLWNGAADAEAFAELVKSLAVDVCAVQEVSPEQAEALSEVMPYGQLEPATNCTGMGLVSSRPCRMDRISMPTRDAPVARFEPGAFSELRVSLEVISVHITAPHCWPLGSSIGLRRAEAGRISDYLSKPADGARVMVGDFNSTPAWPLYQEIASQMGDAAVMAAKARGRKPLRTWGPTDRAPRLLRIDHGFVDGIAVEEFQVVPIPGADHNAIVLDLALS